MRRQAPVVRSTSSSGGSADCAPVYPTGRSGSASGRSSVATSSTPGSLPSARGGSTRYFIGSADLTPSNLDRRVQLLCPVDAPALAARLEEILAANLADTANAWALGPDGAWNRITA